jgi:hypothetical protein
MCVARDRCLNSLSVLEDEFPVAMPVQRLKKSVVFDDNLECGKAYSENRERCPFKKG